MTLILANMQKQYQDIAKTYIQQQISRKSTSGKCCIFSAFLKKKIRYFCTLSVYLFTCHTYISLPERIFPTILLFWEFFISTFNPLD